MGSFLFVIAGLVAVLLLARRYRRAASKEESLSGPRRVAQSCEDFDSWEVGDSIRPELIGSDAGMRMYFGIGDREENTKQHISECLETQQCRKGRFTYRGLTAEGEILLMQEGRKIEITNKHGTHTLFRQREGERPFSPKEYRFKNLSVKARKKEKK